MKDLNTIIYLLSLIFGSVVISFLLANLLTNKKYIKVFNKKILILLVAVMLVTTACSAETQNEKKALEKETEIQLALDKELEEEKETERLEKKQIEEKLEEERLAEEKLEEERLEAERIETERIEAEEEQKRVEEAKRLEEIRLAEEAETQRRSAEKEQREQLAKSFQRGKVTKHVDGDTVDVKLDTGELIRIRMIGVDTPETVHPNKPVQFYGKEASDFTRNTIYNKVVYLEKDVSDTDRYGRSLRYIWRQIPDKIDRAEIENKMFNAILVKSGYANSATFQPDVKYQEYFLELEREARAGGLGLWDSNKAQAFKPPVVNVPSKPKAQANKAPATTNKAPENINKTPAKATPTEGNYVGNRNSMKFHKASCRWASETSPRNRVPFSTREGAINNGYVPCKVCHP